MRRIRDVFRRMLERKPAKPEKLEFPRPAPPIAPDRPSTRFEIASRMAAERREELGERLAELRKKTSGEKVIQRIQELEEKLGSAFSPDEERRIEAEIKKLEKEIS